MMGFSRDDKRQCTLADPHNIKTQGLKFLSMWCTKSGWKILEELPLVLKVASMPEEAEKAAKEIFGEPFLLPIILLWNAYTALNLIINFCRRFQNSV